MTRQEANHELAGILTYLIEMNPDLRFNQILQNYEFVIRDADGNWINGFYTEPHFTLERVRSKVGHNT